QLHTCDRAPLRGDRQGARGVTRKVGASSRPSRVRDVELEEARRASSSRPETELHSETKEDFQGGFFMNLHPLCDRLIVEALEEEESTVSGIVLPDTAKEKPQRGRVLEIGRASW